MSVPLQKMPRCGVLLLALLLCVSGCASHDKNPSRARVAPKYVLPAPVQPAYSAPAPLLSAPEKAPSPPVKVKKRQSVKAAEQSAPRVVPVLDNSLPEQIWQPAVTRKTSLELKS